MEREGEPKITFCAFSLRTRLRARRFALSSAGVAGFSADIAVGFVMIGRLTQLWNCRVYLAVSLVFALALSLPPHLLPVQYT